MNIDIDQIMNRVFVRLINEGKIPADYASPKKISRSKKMSFPDGIHMKYYRLRRKGKKYLFCYSSKKNANGKYLSWVYFPVNDGWEPRRIVEHKLRKKAIERAYKLYSEF